MKWFAWFLFLASVGVAAAAAVNRFKGEAPSPAPTPKKAEPDKAAAAEPDKGSAVAAEPDKGSAVAAEPDKGSAVAAEPEAAEANDEVTEETPEVPSAAGAADPWYEPTLPASEEAARRMEQAGDTATGASQQGTIDIKGVEFDNMAAMRALSFVNNAEEHALKEAGLKGRPLNLILDSRPFANLQALGAVKGMGTKTLEAIRQVSTPPPTGA